MLDNPQNVDKCLSPILEQPVRYQAVFAGLKNFKTEGNQYEKDAINKLETKYEKFKKLLATF